MLSQDSSFRGIVPLGVGAVGGTATSAFTVNDSALFKAIVQVCNPQHLLMPCRPNSSGCNASSQLCFTSAVSLSTRT